MNAFGGGNSSSSIPSHKPKAPLPRPQSQQNQSDQVSILVRPQKVIMIHGFTKKLMYVDLRKKIAGKYFMIWVFPRD